MDTTTSKGDDKAPSGIWSVMRGFTAVEFVGLMACTDFAAALRIDCGGKLVCDRCDCLIGHDDIFFVDAEMSLTVATRECEVLCAACMAATDERQPAEVTHPELGAFEIHPTGDAWSGTPSVFLELMRDRGNRRFHCDGCDRPFRPDDKFFIDLAGSEPAKAIMERNIFCANCRQKGL